MGRLNWALSHGVGHEEEVEFAVNDLWLLHEALVDVGALGWVVDEGLPIRLGLLEETLANALVYDDQRDLRWIVLTLLTLKETIFLLNDLV